MMEGVIPMSEIEQVMDRLRVGIHSGDGINRLHWISFIDFVINNPVGTRKDITHKLISVMGIRERTVLEYINAAVAWGVLQYIEGNLVYNRTYKPKTRAKSNEEPKEEKETKELSPKDQATIRRYRSRLKGG